MPDKVDQYYKETRGSEDGLRNELEGSYNHNRFKVLQKHIRFQILDIVVQRYSDHGPDLKYFVLYHHHDNNQLSQRDIVELLKSKLNRLNEKEKRILIKEAIDEIACQLMKIEITQNRGRVTETLEGQKPVTRKEKRTMLEKAMGDDPEREFLKRLETFDQKTIANFAEAFGLRMRNEEEKRDGKGYKKKVASQCRQHSKERWSDPETREHMCLCMRGKPRRNGKKKT